MIYSLSDVLYSRRCWLTRFTLVVGLDHVHMVVTARCRRSMAMAMLNIEQGRLDAYAAAPAMSFDPYSLCIISNQSCLVNMWFRSATMMPEVNAGERLFHRSFVHLYQLVCPRMRFGCRLTSASRSMRTNLFLGTHRLPRSTNLRDVDNLDMYINGEKGASVMSANMLKH